MIEFLYKGQKCYTNNLPKKLKRMKITENDIEILREFDETEKSPYFFYEKDGISHEVWFEDPRSIKEKLELIYEYNLRGTSYWQIMQLFRSNWLLVDYNFNVEKIKM